MNFIQKCSVSKVSSFKLRSKLKNEFLIYKKEVQVPFFCSGSKFLFSKIAKKVKFKSYGLNKW